MLKHILALHIGAVLLASGYFYGAPQIAEACSGCPTLDISAAHAVVAPDGVLVFNRDAQWGALGGIANDWDEETLELEVRDEAGALVEGDLESASGRLIWRPACQLEPGTVLRPRFVWSDPEPGHLCDPIEEEVFETEPVRVGEEPLASLAIPRSCFSSVYSYLELNTGLDDLACCDDAYPYLENVDPDSCDADEGRVIHYDAGFCAVIGGFGEITTRFSWEPTLDEATAANTVAQLEIERLVRIEDEGGERYEQVITSSPTSLVAALDAPSGPREVTVMLAEALRVRLTLRSLATGERVSGPWVRSDGGAPEEYIGAIEVNRAAELAASCSGQPYTCEIIDYGADPAVLWDSERCAPLTHSTLDPSQIGTQDPSQCVPYGASVEADPPTTTQAVCDGSTLDSETSGDELGCGCAAASPRDAGLALLLLLSPLLVRRRRSR